MIDHLGRRLWIILCMLAGWIGVSLAVLAQTNVDRELARVLEELGEGPPEALFRLGEIDPPTITPEPSSALPVLIAGLDRADKDLRGKIIYALGNLGAHLKAPEDRESNSKPTREEVESLARSRRLRSQVVGALLPLLKDRDSAVRWAAAWSLGQSGRGDDRVVPALIKMLHDEGGQVRNGSPILLQGIWMGGSFEMKREGRGDDMKVAAIQALAEFEDKAAEAVPHLIPILRSQNPRTSWYAAAALSRIGPTKAAVPDLIVALKSQAVATHVPVFFGMGAMITEEARTALPAATALGKLGPDARAAVPDLVEALASPDYWLRCEAAKALGSIGPDAHAAVVALARQFYRADGSIPYYAAEALGHIGPAAIPALIDILRGQALEARVHAARALGVAGPQADKAIPDLLRVSSDHAVELRCAAIEAIGRISRGPVANVIIPCIFLALKDPEGRVRTKAVEALGNLEDRSERVMSALIAALGDREQEVWVAAHGVLSEIGKPALPALVAALGSRDEDTRGRAASVLDDLALPVFNGKDPSEARRRECAQAAGTALRAALGDPEERVRTAASSMLARLDMKASPLLIEALDDPSVAVRLGAARTLSKMGKEARGALGSLENHRNDPDPAVRAAVDAAIRAITKTDPAKP